MEKQVRMQEIFGLILLFFVSIFAVWKKIVRKKGSGQKILLQNI